MFAPTACNHLSKHAEVSIQFAVHPRKGFGDVPIRCREEKVEDEQALVDPKLHGQDQNSHEGLDLVR